MSRRKRGLLKRNLLTEPHEIVQNRPHPARRPWTQLPRVERMTLARCHLPVPAYNVKAEKTLCARRQQLLHGTSRHLDQPPCPDLVPQSRHHEVQSSRKSFRRILTLILRHVRARDQGRRLVKVATTTTTAMMAPSAAERGCVERSNPSSAWGGGSFNTLILDGSRLHTGFWGAQRPILRTHRLFSLVRSRGCA